MRARWPKKLREMVVQGHRLGGSFPELAREFEVPLGTVKTWCRRAEMKPGMKPGPAKGKAAEMKPGMKPEKLATFRGVTALDLPGKDRVEQSMNFFNLKRGTYPPRTWQIPGTLEGEALIAAIQAVCVKWRQPKGGRRP